MVKIVKDCRSENAQKVGTFQGASDHLKILKNVDQYFKYKICYKISPWSTSRPNYSLQLQCI